VRARYKSLNASDRVIDCVKGLRRLGSRKAVLVHAINVRDVGRLYVTLKRSAALKLEQQQERLEAAGFEVCLEICLGSPVREINRLARKQHCSLVVAGSHGETMAPEVRLGSTAHAILQNVKLPILLIPLEIDEEESGRRCRVPCEDLFGHILHPTDFSDVAERAFRYLGNLVRKAKCVVTLLHVQDEGKIHPHLQHKLAEFNRNDHERLECRRAALLKRGASRVNIEIPYGSPTGLILERTRKGGCSLILMGTQGRGFLKELFLGSVSHNVARQTPLPVLFVPAVRQPLIQFSASNAYYLLIYESLHRVG
jgi:nucleotide-binding universal stress UspA family protein